MLNGGWYSSVSAVQTCCDSPSLSLAPSSMLPRRRRVPVSAKFLVAIICDLPDVISFQFTTALSGPAHFLSPDQQSGIHCLIICAIQLLTPNNLGGTWRHICSPDIQSVSALEVLRNRALQIDILLTYLLTSRAAIRFRGLYFPCVPKTTVLWIFVIFVCGDDFCYFVNTVVC